MLKSDAPSRRHLRVTPRNKRPYHATLSDRSLSTAVPAGPGEADVAAEPKRPASAQSGAPRPQGRASPEGQDDARSSSAGRLPSSAAGAAGSALTGVDDSRSYFCACCRETHLLERQCSVALAPFRRKCGWSFLPVARDGDCFYHCVSRALTAAATSESKEELTVANQRDWVAEEITEEQLGFYRIQAAANEEEEWLEFAREPSSDEAAGEPRRVQDLSQLREYVRREGSRFGDDSCLWADPFAFLVIARRLRLSLLLIDMERDKGATPFRILAEAEHPTRCLVLKRQGGAGHFTLLAEASSGTALWPHGGVPNVIRACWPECLCCQCPATTTLDSGHVSGLSHVAT